MKHILHWKEDVNNKCCIYIYDDELNTISKVTPTLTK